MKIYNYDPNNFELTNEREARKSPLDKIVDILPANATFIAPPILTVNQQAVFDKELQTWSITPDYRMDTSYYLLIDGSTIEFTLGQSPDATMSQTFPPAVQATLDEIKREQDIKNEAVVKMQVHIPIIREFHEVELITELWSAINPASKNPTSVISRAINVAETAKTAVTNGIALVDVVWP